MKIAKTLYADEGKILTNGTTFGRIIYLEAGKNETDFYEITDDEYERIMAEQEAAAKQI